MHGASSYQMFLISSLVRIFFFIWNLEDSYRIRENRPADWGSIRWSQSCATRSLIFNTSHEWCDEVELVDEYEYVGMSMQKLCKGQHRLFDLTLSRQWL